MKFNLMLIALFLFSCSKSTEIPIPNAPIQATQIAIPDTGDDAAGCDQLDFTINFEYESYSLDGSEPHPFSSELSGWIPDETEPTFYLISHDFRFCNFLELDLQQYTFTVEQIGNPDGYWYEVTTDMETFNQIVAGLTVTGKLEKNNNCHTRSFAFDLNSEMYTFGGPWKEFDNAFSATAHFQPAEIRIYADNVALCNYLDLELNDYAFSLESEPTPHYKIVLPEADLVPLVNGESLGGRFEYRRKFVVMSNEPKLE